VNKCWRCEAHNAPDTSRCWACGVQLARAAGRKGGYKPEVMRYYSSVPTALQRHRTWFDGLVLLSTVLFGLFLGHFVSDVVPHSLPGERAFNVVRQSPLSFLAPEPRALPVQTLGVAQELRGVVMQVAEVRRARTEAGVEAGSGREFITALVVIDNQGSQPLVYSLNDWKVRDLRGRTITPKVISGAGWLSSGRVAPGQQVLGSISFVVPENESPVQITFTPSGLGALVRWDASKTAS
jgi:hypothetical protein